MTFIGFALAASRPGGPISAPPAPVPVLAAPFVDEFDGTGTLGGRSGWTAFGDLARAGLIRVQDGVARMITAYNGERPEGWQATAPLATRNRILEFGYDFSQTGQGAIDDPALPFKISAQRYAFGFDGPDDHIALVPQLFGDRCRFSIAATVGGVTQDIDRWEGLPVTGALRLVVTDDTLTLFLDGARFDDPRPIGAAAIGARTAIHHQFWPYAIATRWSVVELRVTIDELPLFVGRSSPGVGRDVAIAGGYVGSPVAMLYRVRQEAGDGVVQGWRPLADAAWANGRWSGAVALPEGGPFLVEVGHSDQQGVTHVGRSGPIAVGVLIAYYGQSNALGRCNQAASSGSDNAPLDLGGDPRAFAYGNDGVWRVDRGGGKLYLPRAAMLAHTLAQRIGVPVGAIACGVTGSLIQNLVPSHPNWATLADRLAEIDAQPEALVFDQGEADAFIEFPAFVTDYRGHVDAIIAGVRQLTGRPALPVLISITGRTTGAQPDTPSSIAQASGIRAIQASLHDPANNVWVTAHRVGTALVDGIHPTSAAYIEACRRDALSIAHRVYGAHPHDGRGPLVTQATRSGATITLAVNRNGALAITGDALTGYEVSSDGFASTLPLAAATVSGDAIILTMATPPTGPVAVRSFAGRTYDDSSVALGGYASGGSIPVFPILVPLVTA